MFKRCCRPRKVQSRPDEQTVAPLWRMTAIKSITRVGRTPSQPSTASQAGSLMPLPVVILSRVRARPSRYPLTFKSHGLRRQGAAGAGAVGRVPTGTDWEHACKPKSKGTTPFQGGSFQRVAGSPSGSLRLQQHLGPNAHWPLALARKLYLSIPQMTGPAMRLMRVQPAFSSRGPWQSHSNEASLQASPFTSIIQHLCIPLI